MSVLPNVVRDEIYPPQEDSYLLLRAALAEAKKEDFALEIGCGSGLISLKLMSQVKRMITTDINPFAVRAVKAAGLEVLRADLFRCLKGRFDLIIFNPPYLPTSNEERTSGWINCALDGGESGREAIEGFLEGLKDHIAPEGRALLLISSLTGLKEVREKASSEGLESRVVANEGCFFERLYVLKLQIA